MKIKILPVVLIVAAAFTALSASAATAHSWRVNGSPLTGNKEVRGTSKLTFENTHEGFYSFSCSISAKGTVSTLGLGEITSITTEAGVKAIPCTIVHSSTYCQSAMEIEALGLPWKTELATLSGELRNSITNAAEWKVTCKGIAGTLVNYCVASANTGIKNVATGVEEIYDSNSPRTKCFNDGAGTVLITSGTELLKTREVGAILSAI
jgi:hypothetical protein